MHLHKEGKQFRQMQTAATSEKIDDSYISIVQYKVEIPCKPERIKQSHIYINDNCREIRDKWNIKLCERLHPRAITIGQLGVHMYVRVRVCVCF